MVAARQREKRRAREEQRVPKSHATTIALSEIWSDASLRIEAANFGIEVRKVQSLLRSCGVPLTMLAGSDGICADAAKPVRFKRIYVGRDHGVPLVSSSGIIDLRPDPEKFVSRLLTKKLESIRIQKWDVLISRSGTVGNVSLAGDRLVGMAVSEHAMRLVAPDPQMAGFVTAFLRSRAGRVQLSEASYGSVIVHIEPTHLQRVLVPALPLMQMRTIGEEMRRATELRDDANALLDRADSMLSKALKLPPVDALTKERRARPIVRRSILIDRIDGQFYDPAARALESVLRERANGAVLLGSKAVADVRAVTKFRKRTYVPTGGLPLLPSKQLFQFDPIDVKGLARGAHLKDLPEISLAENMIVVASSGTVSVGRVQIVPRYMGKWAASQDALRVVAAPETNAGYLYAWLASAHGQLLVRRLMYGSVILHIDRDQLSSVLVPLLARKKMDEIGDLVLDANRYRDQAWEHERGAIAQIDAIVGLSSNSTPTTVQR